MARRKMPEEDYDRLVGAIVSILMKNGVRATKMDDIASSLQMSKRTLYEIFGNKDEMVTVAMLRFQSDLLEKNLSYQAQAGNVMDAIMMSFVFYREIMSNINVDFFLDIERFHPDILAKVVKAEKVYFDNFTGLLHRAATEGYIRKDLDYILIARVMQAQMERLKQMSEFFPPDITLLEVFDINAVGFLRGIATPLGLESIDNQIHLFKKVHHA